MVQRGLRAATSRRRCRRGACIRRSCSRWDAGTTGGNNATGSLTISFARRGPAGFGASSARYGSSGPAGSVIASSA